MPLPDRIATARLTGRRIRQDDLPYVLETDGDPRVQMPIFGRVFTPEQTAGRLSRWLDIEREHGLGFYIFSDMDGEAIGHAGLFPSKTRPGRIEIGYALKPAFWGRGYATEMTKAFLDFAFGILGFDSVVAVTRADNTASRRVMEKCGMVLESAFDIDGVSAVCYAAARPTAS